MLSLRFFLSCLITSSTFHFSASSVAAAPSLAPHVVEDILLKRQASNAPFPVTGVQIGQVLPRYEIRDLQNNHPDQFNVYLLGLQRLQQVNQSDFLSWFQISGIHGVPKIPWNGVAGVGGSNNNNPGYCTHTSNLFLPWHRPYLALYEQVVISQAQAVANDFPPGPIRDKYLTAAATLRIPYWDWAMDPPAGENSIPSCMTDITIQVIAPNGTETIANPLYSYTFHPIDPGLAYMPYIQWSQTLRWPTDIGADAQTQVDVLISQVNSNQNQMKQRLYNLFTGMSNFSEFGNEAWIPNGGAGTYDSLESIHDQIHGTVGGSNYGDMTVIAVSAFDPSFWLHHAMVDRAFALWQAIYPDSYVEPQKQLQSTFWYNTGSTQDANSPLKPFYADSSGNFWTSNSVRNLTTFGYTYSELLSNDSSAVRTAINSLYGSNSIQKRKYRRNTDPTGQYRLWQINVRAPKNVLNGSYFIDFFHGPPPSENMTDSPTDPNLIGSHAVIFSMQITGNMPTVTTTGVVPLNAALESMLAAGTLTDLSEESVMSVLRDGLTWQVRMGDNRIVPVEGLPELKVAVASVAVQPAVDASQFPTFLGNWEVYPAITNGKPGGLHFGDPI